MATECGSTKLKRSRHHHHGFQKETTTNGLLNNLPDHILPHILSFLDVKLAVQTSVLSRRWRNLWKDISALDLSATSIGRMGPSLGTKVRKLLQSLRSHHDRSIVTSITFGTHYNIYEDNETLVFDLFESVMEYAATGRLQDLSVVQNSGGTLVTSAIYDSIIKNRHNLSLETLRLEQICILSHPNDVIASSGGFSSLTTLELRRCFIDGRFTDDSRGRHLLSSDNFPSLKYLKMICCHSYKPVTVSVAQLLDLEIRSPDLLFRLEAVIAPKLRSFSFSGHLIYLDRLEHLSFPSLDHASIRLFWLESGDMIKRERELNRAFENVLLGLRNVKSLDLCFDYELESWCKRKELINCLLMATRSFAVYEVSPFTRLETLRIQYPEDSSLENENENDNESDKVIRYHFQGFRGVGDSIC